MLETKCQENARAIAQQIKASGASTASDVAYDNTSSGLTADDVQEAIDELASSSGGGSVDYTKTETEIGTFLGDKLYRCVYELTNEITLASNAYENMSFSISFSKLVNIFGVGSSGNYIPCAGYKDGTALAIRPCISSGSVYVKYVCVDYTKPAEA